MFCGQPGTGKTSILKCLVTNVLGKYEKSASRVINSYNDRGVNVKDTINAFCKSQLILTDDEGNEITNIQKIIVVDEVDNLTDKGQQNISELMDQYKNNVRFLFTCNDSTKVVDIQKECNISRCGQIPKKEMLVRLKEICELEDIKYEYTGLKLIVTNSHGDMRTALNNLEIVNTSYKLITSDNVLKICDVPRPEDIKILIQYCYEKKFNNIYEIFTKLKHKGHSNIDILNSIFEQVKEVVFEENKVCKFHGEEYKIKFISMTADTILIVNKGISSQLQMSAYFSRLCKI